MSRPGPTWLVTGGSGFLGRHLLNRLDREPVRAVAIGRRPIDREGLRSFVVDLANREALIRTIDETTPSTIFHLAGRTPPADAAELDAANRRATVHLVEALVRIGRPTRLISAGSAAELGPVAFEALPVGEFHPARPDTDYGRSKLAATEAVLAAPSPIAGVVARVFNPIGPGMPVDQAFGRFAAMLADDRTQAITTGDLGPKRDFIDVRDVAEALIALARSTATGLFHVGTGRSRSVGEGLDRLIAASGRMIQVNRDDGPSRGPADSRADIARITTVTGWTPVIDFDRSVADVFEAAKAGRG